jgi:hypothetical protein
MRFPAILFAVPTLLAGCAPVPLTPAEQWAISQFGEKVTMNVAAGKYQHYVIEGLNKGRPFDITATLGQPRSTTTWAPSMRLCARGERLSEHSCVWLIVDGDQKTIYATPYSGSDPVEAGRNALSYRSRVGATMAITIKLQPSSFSLSIDGQPLLTKATEFEVKGYSFGCVSATCSFYFPD